MRTAILIAVCAYLMAGLLMVRGVNIPRFIMARPVAIVVYLAVVLFWPAFYVVDAVEYFRGRYRLYKARKEDHLRNGEA
jgi:hypothetical protein